jgi:hypothetical protein
LLIKAFIGLISPFLRKQESSLSKAFWTPLRGNDGNLEYFRILLIFKGRLARGNPGGLLSLTPRLQAFAASYNRGHT